MDASLANTILVRCYAELNDHLPRAYRQRDMAVALQGMKETVGSVMARLGIPEEEVDAALRNGEPVTAGALLEAGDRLSLYPVFETFDVSGATEFRTTPLRVPRFILDVHLGKLASYLRMMGYDAMYWPGFNDDELVSISIHEARTLLSKDRRMLEHRMLTRAYLIEAVDPKEQLIEVLDRFMLINQARPFTRCIVCNTRLMPVEKKRVESQLPERVREDFAEFLFCPFCEKAYWKGSHYKRMTAFIEEVRQRLRSSG